MAELLLRGIDNDGPESAVYKAGDTVVVRPDGWSWGRREDWPVSLGGEFWIIKLPGVDPAALDYLTKPDTVRVGIRDDMVLRRKFNMVIPPPVRSQLNNGPITNPPGWQVWVQQRERP
jgi:hypothetical protein